jgi:hypothetical protein
MHRLLALVFVAVVSLGCETSRREVDPAPCVSQCGLNQVACQQFCRTSPKDDCQDGCHEGYKVCVKACGAK